jgi:UPF0755 protein
VQSLGILLVFAFLFLVAATFFVWKALATPYRGYTASSRLVEVKKGWKSSTILRQLERDGILRDDFIPLLFLKTVRRGESLKAGVYEFSRPIDPLDVMDKLIRGDVVFRNVTVREGLDRFALADLMQSEGFGSRKEWLAVTAQPDLVHDLDPRAETLEGYLFPDTYKLAPGATVTSIAKIMTDNFRKHFGGELAFFANGLDVHDTVTLASIVEAEAKVPGDRPLVASVYLNRYRIKMPLQADPTVIYAMKLSRHWGGNIRKTDLQSDSPWNTYRVRGFPPGPITNPGLPSLRAAASPAQTNFLYFVARPDGSHAFAHDLAEHNRNVERYQKLPARLARRASSP